MRKHNSYMLIAIIILFSVFVFGFIYLQYKMNAIWQNTDEYSFQDTARYKFLRDQLSQTNMRVSVLEDYPKETIITHKWDPIYFDYSKSG